MSKFDDLKLDVDDIEKRLQTAEISLAWLAPQLVKSLEQLNFYKTRIDELLRRSLDSSVSPKEELDRQGKLKRERKV